MGRGEGCTGSKAAAVEDTKPAPAVATKPQTKPATPPAPTATTVNGTAKPIKMAVKVFIIYYSMYGHIAKMARKVKEGVDSVAGVEGILYQVAETLPEEVLGKMHAPPKADVPIISSHELTEADGFIFGTPTRFGNFSAQFKTFWDSTGQLWQKGSLAGKPFGVFTSTATQGGGQENTISSGLSNFVNHGMVFIPPGYSMGPELFSNEAVRGGSAWGAGTFAGGDGSRQPTELELAFAKHQGEWTAKIIKKIAA